MTDVYSPVLAASLAFVVGTVLCLVSERVSRSSHLRRLSVVGACLSLASVVLALASHVALGHAPGTDTALAPAAFVAEHPMAVVVLLSAGALLVFSLRAVDRRRDEPRVR